jgi:hypothetical protein
MTSALAPIADKLGKLIRMLTCERDGEALGAARAIGRTLDAAGLDIHALAAGIGKTFSEQEAIEIYQRGVDDGRREAENARHASVDFHNIDGTPDWHEMATWCAEHGARLQSRERDFVDQMASQTVWRDPTEKQGKWLKSIFYRLGGKRP